MQTFKAMFYCTGLSQIVYRTRSNSVPERSNSVHNKSIAKAKISKKIIFEKK